MQSTTYALAACCCVTTALALFYRNRAQSLLKFQSKAIEERLARIRLERRSRAAKNFSSVNDQIFIGHIRTMFSARYGTPRQGALAKSTRGVVRIDKSALDPGALSGLDQYSFVWLLFLFHENTNEHKIENGKNFKAMIRPPGMNGGKTGVLATRSPHRPNRLGLSLVRVVSVDEKLGKLTVSGVDLLDNTPILDVKPFVPADVPWADVAYPTWVSVKMNDGDSAEVAPLDVRFTEMAKEQLGERIKGSEWCRVFFTDVEEAVGVLSEALRLDCRAVHHGRYDAPAAEQYETLRMNFCDFTMTVQYLQGAGENDVDYANEFADTAKSGTKRKPLLLVKEIVKAVVPESLTKEKDSREVRGGEQEDVDDNDGSTTGGKKR